MTSKDLVIAVPPKLMTSASSTEGLSVPPSTSGSESASRWRCGPSPWVALRALAVGLDLDGEGVDRETEHQNRKDYD